MTIRYVATLETIKLACEMLPAYGYVPVDYSGARYTVFTALCDTLERALQAEAEVERLKHDVERLANIAHEAIEELEALRNPPEVTPDTVEDWAIEATGTRALPDSIRRDVRFGYSLPTRILNHACLIQQFQPWRKPKPKIDPDLLEAREMALADGVERTRNQAEVIRNSDGTTGKVAMYLAGIKRGRELAKEHI